MPCGAGVLERQVNQIFPIVRQGFIEAPASLTVVDVTYRPVDINKDST
jgi:hypothetical protein